MSAKYSPRQLSDDEAERAVLSAIVISRDAALTLTDRLHVEDFYSSTHQKIFKAMKELSERDATIDELTLTNQLRITNRLNAYGVQQTVDDLAQQMVSLRSAEDYARIVKQNGLARNIAKALMEGLDLIYTGDNTLQERVAHIENAIFQATAFRDTVPIITPKEGVWSVVKRIEAARSRGGALPGIATDITEFDALLGGWQPGTFNVIAGRPGMGKTAFALQSAQRAAVRYRLPVAIFSYEMLHEPLFARMISNENRIDGKLMQTGHLDSSQWAKLTDACSRLAEAPIYMVESHSMMVNELASMARRMVKDYNIRLFVIDYIQRIPMERGETQEQQVSDVVGKISSLAQSLEVPILALSQLNRGSESTSDKRPEASNLKSSGRIEADADSVTILFREDYYNTDQDNANRDNTLELMVKKNRYGDTGTAKCYWDGRHSRIDNITTIR